MGHNKLLSRNSYEKVEGSSFFMINDWTWKCMMWAIIGNLLALEESYFKELTRYEWAYNKRELPRRVEST